MSKPTRWACAMCGHVVVTADGKMPEPLHWTDGHICGPFIPWTKEKPKRARPKDDLMVEDGLLSFGEDDDDDGS